MHAYDIHLSIHTYTSYHWRWRHIRHVSRIAMVIDMCVYINDRDSACMCVCLYYTSYLLHTHTYKNTNTSNHRHKAPRNGRNAIIIDLHTHTQIQTYIYLISPSLRPHEFFHESNSLEVAPPESLRWLS